MEFWVFLGLAVVLLPFALRWMGRLWAGGAASAQAARRSTELAAEGHRRDCLAAENSRDPRWAARDAEATPEKPVEQWRGTLAPGFDPDEPSPPVRQIPDHGPLDDDLARRRADRIAPRPDAKPQPRDRLGGEVSPRPLSHRDLLRNLARRAMVERGLLPEFSPAVLAETRSIEVAATATDPTIRDLRELLWASIDNDDSRDLDQLTVAAEQIDGTVKLRIAVADVDAVVAQNSAIDGHARANTTSVYTAAEIFPMLPERLSTDLTSLGPGEDRLALVIEMTVGADGAVGAAEIYRGLVRNRAQLAYDSVAAWLDGTAPAPPGLAAVPGLDEQLRLQDRVAQALQGLRHQAGALSLETVEARPVFDGDALAHLRPEEKNRARQLIEDFMIAANGATARYLVEKGFPSLRRVLRDPERWPRIVELAVGLGEHLPPEPNAGELEKFLAKRRQVEPEQFPDLSLAVVKLLGAGEYVVERPGERTAGHFGLAVRDYTHATAPNRRFPDLATQRLLKAALAGREVPYGDDELAALAAHCTKQEDNAAKVERQVRKSAAALLLAGRIGERFAAIVTGASAKGTWVRIAQPVVEGKVVQGASGLDVGDRVEVELLRTDVERGFIDFARAREGRP